MRAPIPSPCNFSSVSRTFFRPLLGSLQDTNLGLSKFPIYFSFQTSLVCELLFLQIAFLLPDQRLRKSCSQSAIHAWPALEFVLFRTSLSENERKRAVSRRIALSRMLASMSVGRG
jgi:hypothetical protein